MRPDNPVRGVKRFADGKSDRFLSAAELASFGEILSAAESSGVNASALAALRLLALTGCRKNEILSLKWELIDWDHACLRLPDSKTGAKIVPLGAPALELLASLPHLEGSSTNGLARRWSLKRLQRDLTHVLRRPVEVALRKRTLSVGIDSGGF